MPTPFSGRWQVPVVILLTRLLAHIHATTVESTIQSQPLFNTSGNSSGVDSDADGLPDDYEMGAARYQVVEVPSAISWTDANADASQRINAFGVRGHLVTITSETELQLVTSLVKQKAVHSPRACWIGLRETHGEGTYEWVTGEGLSYTHWDAGEPNNVYGTSDEQYVMVRSGEMQGLIDCFHDDADCVFCVFVTPYLPDVA